mmetsp:Transcript_30488/g.62898  ORF Transcript_30488/g.62898 Transcript_30488/m.62898 type:complete len:291 (-) Transcript_30488:6819-7691(-)
MFRCSVSLKSDILMGILKTKNPLFSSVPPSGKPNVGGPSSSARRNGRMGPPLLIFDLWVAPTAGEAMAVRRPRRRLDTLERTTSTPKSEVIGRAPVDVRLACHGTSMNTEGSTISAVGCSQEAISNEYHRPGTELLTTILGSAGGLTFWTEPTKSPRPSVRGGSPALMALPSERQICVTLCMAERSVRSRSCAGRRETAEMSCERDAMALSAASPLSSSGVTEHTLVNTRSALSAVEAELSLGSTVGGATSSGFPERPSTLPSIGPPDVLSTAGLAPFAAFSSILRTRMR